MVSMPISDETPKMPGHNPKWLTALLLGGLVIGILMNLGCATLGQGQNEYADKDFPMSGCIVHREMNSEGLGTTEERVTVLGWRDSEHIEVEVKYPDSRSQSTYFVRKESVTFGGCSSQMPGEIQEMGMKRW